MSTSVDSIRKRMQDVRHELNEDMIEIVESSREMTDWRTYVKRFPWLCTGAAFALGYMIIPPKNESHQILTADAKTLLELAKTHKVDFKGVDSSPKYSSITKSAIELVSNLVINSVVGYAKQQIKTIGSNAMESSKKTQGQGEIHDQSNLHST